MRAQFPHCDPHILTTPPVNATTATSTPNRRSSARPEGIAFTVSTPRRSCPSAARCSPPTLSASGAEATRATLATTSMTATTGVRSWRPCRARPTLPGRQGQATTTAAGAATSPPARPRPGLASRIRCQPHPVRRPRRTPAIAPPPLAAQEAMNVDDHLLRPMQDFHRSPHSRRR